MGEQMKKIKKNNDLRQAGILADSLLQIPRLSLENTLFGESKLHLSQWGMKDRTINFTENKIKELKRRKEARKRLNKAIDNYFKK